MKKVIGILLCMLILGVLLGTAIHNGSFTTETLPSSSRDVIVLSLADGKPVKNLTIPATKVPEFSYDISAQKFNDLLHASKKSLQDFVEAKLIPVAHAHETVETDIITDKKTKKLLVKPRDSLGMTPGKYLLSLKLRTLEGEVSIEQDFTWGVIAVNTNKSIYKPGDVATIGMGVLNDLGETQCMTGDATAKVWLTVTDPQGGVKQYSTDARNIMDSGKCGPITVTNEPDFVAIYLISGPGIYTMKVTAEVGGEKRMIEDYFKVATDTPFDVERKSFPTRIYPHATYNVLFTVTPKEDYTGTIEEFMPDNFITEKITDGGIFSKNKEIGKITWKVNLKKGETKEFRYSIHFPLVSPEFYLLGPITIGDFTEARQWQIASDAINSTSGVLTYEDNNGSNTFSRIWTGSAFNSQTNMSATPTDSRWFREVSSPKTGEKIVALIDNTTNDPVMVLTWNGTSWSLDKNLALGSGSADVTRPFDIAYEDVSGDALLVLSNYSSNQLRYYKRVNGVWDTGTTFAAATAAGTAYDVYKRWVRLEPQLGSDSILVGYLTNNERVGAMIWDGATNSMGNQFDESSSTITATSDEQAFDIAWETQSGTPMIFWGTTGNNLVMREFTGGNWQAESTIASGFTNDLDWVAAAADPVSTSNYIALGLQDNTTCRVRFGIWDGSSLTMNGTTATCPSATTNVLIDTAFEYNTGEAMWIYVPDDATDDNIAWLTWTSGGGFTSATNITKTANPDVIEGVQLYSDLLTNHMMLLFHDNAATCDLWTTQWNGVSESWETITNSSLAYDSICASADNDTQPYGFGFDRNLETMAAYRWFTASGTVAVSSALTSQDTPYTLTQPNQQFRLRLLLYYPDAVAINGRQYKLQFVDPGSGTCANPSGGTPSTWTDVPTSGSEISFYNNTTPADGDNLTSNASLDPTYQSYDPTDGAYVEQDYEEANNFTNSVSAMSGDQVALWDFSLIDNTTYDRNAQTFCFRVARSNDLVLQIVGYPQISTAAVADVLIQGGSLIQGGTLLQ